MLTNLEVTKYHEDGYVIPGFRLSEEILNAIRKAHARLIDAYPGFADYCPAILPLDTSFLQFARNERILDIVAQLIGDDIALWNSSFFAKPARVGSRTPWHQDGQYWAIRPLATCTVWIAVDAATRENGCLRVIRGSHKGRTLAEHRTNNAPGLALNLELTPEEFDEADAVDLVLEAGQISLHDVFLYHGSEPNRSDLPRRGMTLRFMPTTSHYDREIERERFADDHYPWATREQLTKLARLPLYLMRGTDRCGLNEGLIR